MEHTVTEDQNNQRADKILKNICKEVSYTFLQKIFRTNHVKVNGKKVSASDKLHSGDVIKVYADVSAASEISTEVTDEIPSKYKKKLLEQLKNMIIFENDDMFAINKPAGLAVQGGTKISNCVDNMIKIYSKSHYHENSEEKMDCAASACKYHLVHRLDKETSGVLLIAKNQSTAQKLTSLFRENSIEKTYLAIVDGKIEKSGVIDNFIEKDLNKERMCVSDRGQHAITHYKPIKRVGYNTLLELKPLTGRKHQLRVHCAEVLKSPVLGDRKYCKNPVGSRMLLHAYRVKIKELGIEIVADIPGYFIVEYSHII